ncbi:DNA translocase FtsK 4TM domain-containing protein, partial [Brucella abortus]
MRQGYSPSYPLRDERITEDRLRFANLVRRQVYILLGLGLLSLTAMAVGALATWNVADPSFSHATDNPVTNALGYPGAVFSDLAMQFFGLASVPALLPLAVWSLLLMIRGYIGRIARRSLAWVGAALLFAAIASCFAVPQSWPMPIGLGGVFGDMLLRIPGFFLGGFPQGAIASAIALVLAFPALWFCFFASGIIGRGAEAVNPAMLSANRSADDEFADEDADNEAGGGFHFIGALTHLVLMTTATIRRMTGLGRRRSREDDFDDMRMVRRSAETRNAPPPRARKARVEQTAPSPKPGPR